MVGLGVGSVKSVGRKSRSGQSMFSLGSGRKSRGDLRLLSSTYNSGSNKSAKSASSYKSATKASKVSKVSKVSKTSKTSKTQKVTKVDKASLKSSKPRRRRRVVGVAAGIGGIGAGVVMSNSYKGAARTGSVSAARSASRGGVGSRRGKAGVVCVCAVMRKRGAKKMN